MPGLAVRDAVPGALIEAVLTLVALGGRAKPDPVDPVTVFLEPKRSWLARDEGRSMFAQLAGRQDSLKQRSCGLSYLGCRGRLVLYLSGTRSHCWRYAELFVPHHDHKVVAVKFQALP